MTESFAGWQSDLDDPEAFRAFAHKAVDLAADYLRALPNGPVYQQMPLDARTLLMEAQLPAEGLEPAAILEQVRSDILPTRWGTATRVFSAGSTRRRRR